MISRFKIYIITLWILQIRAQSFGFATGKGREPPAWSFENFTRNPFWWLDKSDAELKTVFGCPDDDWDILKQNNLSIPNSCVETGYKANYPPINDGVLNLYTTFSHQKVLTVNEIDQTVTINIKESTTWEDRRIFTSFSRNNSFFGYRNAIELSPLALHGAYPIWIPTWFLHIFNLKEWKSLFAPVFLSELGFMEDNPFNVNVTLVNASLEWKVTIFCNFDFEAFPFDTQTCPYRIRNSGSPLIRNTLFDPEHKYHYERRYDACGFNVITELVGNDYLKGNQNESMDRIGFNITMKRIIQPYLFQYFLPCMAIVVVSFISFLVPLTAIPGRIALVVTQFLTLTNIFIHQMVSNMLSDALCSNNLIFLQKNHNTI